MRLSVPTSTYLRFSRGVHIYLNNGSLLLLCSCGTVSLTFTITSVKYKLILFSQPWVCLGFQVENEWLYAELCGCLRSSLPANK